MGTLPSEGEAGDLSGSVAALPELPDPLGLETNELMTRVVGTRESRNRDEEAIG